MNIIKNIFALILCIVLAGCISTPAPPLVYKQGAVADTLSTAISLSFHTAGNSMAGSGFMVYKRPDKVHMIMLSPFGTTLFEVFALGDRITLVYPSQSVAYSGHFNQLPSKGGLQGWNLMQWVMDADPVSASMTDGVYERSDKKGHREKITIKQGLITNKDNFEGDHIYYSNYTVINDVPVATEIDIRNKIDDRISLKLQETEINRPIDDAAFVPRLDGFNILPLSAIETL